MVWTSRYGKGAERGDLSGIIGRYCGLRRLKADFRRRTYQRQHLPWVQRTYPGRKYGCWWSWGWSTPPGPPSSYWWNYGLQQIGGHIRQT
jgi:hypothetical protein